MRKFATFTLLLFVWFGAVSSNSKVWKSMKKDINIFVISDSGRNGYYDQKPIAEVMGQMAEKISPRCVVATGDVHHFDGIQSVQDPLWMTNYELIYSHPKLMIPWLPILGNHEYRGNTKAVIEYSDISRRWCMPDRYYTKVYKVKGATLRIVMIDTTPIIEQYRRSKDSNYASVAKQDYNEQLEWLNTVLSSATEDWIIVVGHHPIYADTGKSNKERRDMQNRVGETLRRYEDKVDLYICGHIHNFQHIRRGDCKIDYIVNSSAARGRSVKAIEGTKFCSPVPGFSVLAADKKSLCLHMINSKGEVLNTITRTK